MNNNLEFNYIGDIKTNCCFINRFSIIKSMIVELIGVDPYSGVKVYVKDKVLYKELSNTPEVITDNPIIIEAYLNMMNLYSFYEYVLKNHDDFNKHIKLELVSEEHNND